MRQLMLLRHAKSSWDDTSLPDHERPLNARGMAAAAAMGGTMRAMGLTPDLVLVSTAVRTRQTLDALDSWDETPLIEPLDGLYLATEAQLLAVLGGVAETVRSVLLIGHNPGLHDLALALIGPGGLNPADPGMRRLSEGFPTAGLAEFDVVGPWATLGTTGARLRHFLDPRDGVATG